MSVSVTNDVLIVPVYHDPNQDPNSYDKSLIARWHSMIAVVGDASGGVYAALHRLSNVGQMFGSKTLFDVRFASMIASAVFAATPMAQVNIQSYELTNLPVPAGGLRFWCVVSVPTNWGMWMLTNNELPRFKFRTTQDPAYPTYLYQECSQNTAGISMTFSCGGYLYDERYLRSD